LHSKTIYASWCDPQAINIIDTAKAEIQYRESKKAGLRR